MTNAIIYTRFSPRRDADESLSCEQQRDACIRYCESLRYQYDLECGYFEDRAQSGSDADRPGLWAAIDSLSRGAVLVVRWRHRLAREVYLSEVIKRAVKKAGARIEAAEEGSNGDSPDDVMIQQVLAALAERERKVSAVRTKYAMLRHQSEGRLMGSIAPYGTDIDPSNPAGLIKNTAERAVIAAMRDLRSQGQSYRAVAHNLGVLGYKPRSGGEWGCKTVYRILRRENATKAMPGG